MISTYILNIKSERTFKRNMEILQQTKKRETKYTIMPLPSSQHIFGGPYITEKHTKQDFSFDDIQIMKLINYKYN